MEGRGEPTYLTKRVMVMTTVGLFKTSVGTAVLSMPKAMADCGLVLYAVLLFGFCLVAQYGCLLIAQSLDMRDVKDMDPLKLSEYSLGTWGKWFTLAMTFLDPWGSTIAFFSTIADILRPLLLDLCGSNECMWTTHGFIIGALLVIVYPLMLSRHISEISWINLLGISSLLAFGVGILVNLSQHYVGLSDLDESNFTGDAVVALTVIAFAYDGCQMNMFPFYRDLPYPRKGRKGPKLFMISCVANMLGACCYFGVALMAYATFGKALDKDVLNNFTNGSVLYILIKVSFAAALLFSIPVTLFECSSVIRAHILGEGALTNALLNMALVGSAAWLAVFVPSMYTAFGYVGATTGTIWAFVLPALWFIYTTDKVYSGDEDDAPTDPESQGILPKPTRPPKPTAFELSCAYVLLAAGVVCVPFFVYITHLNGGNVRTFHDQQG